MSGVALIIALYMRALQAARGEPAQMGLDGLLYCTRIVVFLLTVVAGRGNPRAKCTLYADCTLYRYG